MANFENAGIRLKMAREAAGFKTAKEFYEKHNLPASTYSLHESGGRNLKPKIAQRYGELLGVSASWLLTGVGSPYNTEATKEEKPLSHHEFIQLLNYQGNTDVKKSFPYSVEILPNINPLIFCKIVVGISEVLQQMDFHLDIQQISKKAVEVYNDILQSSNDQETQLTMVSLSLTMFKRQIQEIISNQNKRKVANG